MQSTIQKILVDQLKTFYLSNGMLKYQLQLEGKKLNGGAIRICTIFACCNPKFDHLYKVVDRLIAF